MHCREEMNWRRYFCALAVGLFFLSGTSLFAQTISNFFPVVGTTNDVIKIMGSGFNSGNPVTVQFWNKRTAAINIGNDQNLTATVPAGAVQGSLGIYRTPGTVTNFTSQEFIMI